MTRASHAIAGVLAAVLASGALASLGCRPGGPQPGPEPTPDASCVRGSRGKPSQTVFGGTRPVTLSVPSTYDLSCPAPLVILLHGYGGAGWVETAYLGLDTLVEGRGVLFAAPDGTLDPSGREFWNPGTPACCNFYGSAVDDVAYLTTLLRDIRAVYAVDPERVFLVGHSNGGFMAHRLACVADAGVTGLVSLAGTMDPTPPACDAPGPVSMLQVHGDADDVVLYDGGTAILGLSGPYASAPFALSWWAGVDGCSGGVSSATPIDLETTIGGAETTVLEAEGCAHDAGVALWTIQGGSHIPTMGTRFAPLVWQWLDGHRPR